jgi:TRAP-type uncharacterized transport system substrate-binding protein
MKPALALMAVLALGACGRQTAPAAAPERPLLRIAGSQLAEELVKEIAAARPDLNVTHVTAAPIAVDPVRQGQADLGVIFADSVYFAHLAEGVNQTAAHRGIRAISALHVAPMLMFVRQGSGVRSVADMRGHTARISPNPIDNDPRFSGWPVPKSLGGLGAGTVSGVTSLPLLVLLAHGILPTDVVNKPISPTEAAIEMTNGTLDASLNVAFESNPYPADAFRRGHRLASIEGPAIDRLRRTYSFIRPVRLPAGTYPGQTYDVRTVGVNMVLVCRADLDEQLAYDLTRLYFAALPRLVAKGNLAGIDPQQAPLTPIPLHEGAARYFRETELFR